MTNFCYWTHPTAALPRCTSSLEKVSDLKLTLVQVKTDPSITKSSKARSVFLGDSLKTPTGLKMTLFLQIGGSNDAAFV